MRSSPADTAPEVSHVTAIVLAAGQSQRMGDANKLLLPVQGIPMIRRVVDTVESAPVEDVIVVTGHEAERVRKALTGTEARIVHNTAYESGMASSLRRGIKAAASDPSGFMIVLGDLPLLQQNTLAKLARHFADAPSESILIPTHEGWHGHPVVFDAAHREALLQLDGDVGARPIIEANAEHVTEIEVDDPGIHRDIDTEAAYQALRAQS